MHRRLAITALVAMAIAVAAPAARASSRSYSGSYPGGSASAIATQESTDNDNAHGNRAFARVISQDPVTDGANARGYVEQSHYSEEGYQSDGLTVFASAPFLTIFVNQNANESGGDHGQFTEAGVTGVGGAGEYAYTQGDYETCERFVYLEVTGGYQSFGCPTGDALLPVAPTAPALPDLVGLLP